MGVVHTIGIAWTVKDVSHKAPTAHVATVWGGAGRQKPHAYRGKHRPYSNCTQAQTRFYQALPKPGAGGWGERKDMGIHYDNKLTSRQGLY